MLNQLSQPWQPYGNRQYQPYGQSGAHKTQDFGCASTPHPVVVQDGNKQVTEVDFWSHHLASIGLVRYYNRYDYEHTNLFGNNWSSNFDIHLNLSAVNLVGQNQVLVAYREDGSSDNYYYITSTGHWQSSYTATDTYIVQNANGTWSQISVGGQVVNYNSTGQLTSSVDQNGLGWTLSYSGGQLQTATHSDGMQVKFTWTNGVVTSVTDPSNNVYTYSYNGALSGVTYPGNPSHVRTYFYENPNWPSELTGIAVDGARYSTYKFGSFYNSRQDRQVSMSGLEDGTIDQLNFSYSGDPSIPNTTTTITNSAGAKSVINYVGGSTPASTSTSGVTGCPNTTASVTYNSSTGKTVSLDQRGIESDYVYSSNDMLQSVTTGASDPSTARTTSYTYDAKYRNTEVDTFGPSSTPIAKAVYTYDDSSASRGRIKSIVVTNLTANGVTNQTQTTNYSYQFYSSGMPSSITVSGPLAGSTGYVTSNYDTVGNLTSLVDANGNATTYSGYNGLGLPASVTDPNGYTVNFTYDARGNMLSSARTLDGVSATTSYSYTGMNQLAGVQYPDGGSYNYSYDAAGRLISETNNVTTSTLNSQCSMYAYTTAEKDYTYNNLSNVTAVTEQTDIDTVDQKTCEDHMTYKVYYSSAMGYDSLGRLTSKTGNNSQNFVYTYDADGNIATKTDSLGKVTSFSYNAHNQVQSVTDPLNNVTSYTYDGAGNLASVTDPKGNVTSYYFDGFNHLTKLTSPDTGTTTYAYDSSGRLTTTTQSNGVTTSISYTSLNRVSTMAAGGLSQTFAYDTCTNGKTRLCGVSDASGSTSFTYRQNGQTASQTSVISGTSYTTSWSYDNRDRVSSINYPGGNAVGYQYNGQSEVTAVTATVGGVNTTVASGLTYAGLGLGPLVSMNMGDGSATTWTYDTDLRLTGLTTNLSPKLSYTYDANNSITKITNANNANLTQTFGLDTDYRLTGVTAGVGNQSIAFDANSNRTSATWGGITDTYSPNSANNQISSISGSRARSFAYDSVGNMTTATGWNGNRTYTYDAFNHLSSVNNAGATTNYTYNALGQRARKSGASGSYNYIYGRDGTLLAETGQNSTTIGSQYIWLGSQPIGLIRGGTLYYIHDDHLGRPDTLTSGTSGNTNIVWQAQNTAFDRTVSTNTIGGLNIGFPGQYYDSESGLYYNMNRYYDPTLGRYLQTDPLAQYMPGANPYLYALNNPVLLIDPTGLDWQYSQSTGQLSHNGTPVGTGYSGNGQGLNNSSMQNVPNTGPIPQGTWTMGAAYNSPNTGKNTIPLSPAPGTDTLGRDAFRIHGDNSQGDHSASEGCIVTGPNVRNQIINSGDTTLTVTP